MITIQIQLSGLVSLTQDFSEYTMILNSTQVQNSHSIKYLLTIKFSLCAGQSLNLLNDPTSTWELL